MNKVDKTSEFYYMSAETGELVNISVTKDGIVYLTNGEEQEVVSFAEEFVVRDDPESSGRYKVLSAVEIWRRVMTMEYLQAYLDTNEEVLEEEDKDNLRTLLMMYKGVPI